MKKSKKIFAIVCSCSVGFMLCTPKTVIRPETFTTNGCPPVLENTAVDTLAYTITFPDSAYRQEFIGSFRSFLDHYQFQAKRNDSAINQVVIRMVPPPAAGQSASFLSPVEPEWITESTIEKREIFGEPAQPAISETTLVADTITPINGGKIRLHMQHTGIDATFLDLIAVDPFSKNDSSASSLLAIDAPSSKKISVKLNGKIIDGSGKLVSALDLIEAWTSYIKKHPAEGFALFRYVDGIIEFIQGKEAVVRGFGAADQQTCYLKLTQPDALSLERIKTQRFCGLFSRLGSYYPVNTTAQEMVLVANHKTATIRQPFLDTLVLNISDDQNPILSFSLRKYDAITLTFLTDINYARTTLVKQADLHLLSHDRYFITCAVSDSGVRRYLASQLNAADLLSTTVKAEGIPIRALASDSTQPAESDFKEKPAPPVGRQFRILFRKDDPVSRTIAEKLLADLSGSGIRSSLLAADVTDYERQLIERKYECAVGWVDERVRNDRSEQLRLATIYFNDMQSEQERITGFWELPLFSVNRYLLMRKPAGLYRETMGGIYASARPTGVNESQ